MKFDFSYWLRTAFVRGIVPGLIALSFGLAWRRWMQPESILELVLATAVVPSIYLLSILLFCLDQEERYELKHLPARLFLQRTDKPFNPPWC